MSDLSHAYLHPASVADADACAEVRADLRVFLAELDARDEIAGYRMVVVGDRERAENELLDFMCDYGAVTGGGFPFVYALVTPGMPDTVDLDKLMRARGFQRVA